MPCCQTNILSHAIRLPHLARSSSRQIPGTIRRFPQKRFRKAQHHLAWPQRNQLHDSLHSPQAHQHLERHQHQERPAAQENGANASRWSQGFRRSHCKKVRHLLLRATEERAIQRTAGKAVSRQQDRLEILSLASSLVSEGDNLLGHQRKEGRDKAQASFRTHRLFAASANATPTHSREEEVTWPLAM